MATAVLAYACAGAPAAQADLSWSSATTSPPSPQTISPTGTDADEIQVATDSAGDAIAVWSQTDAGGTLVIEEAKRPAGGNFGAYKQVSSGDADASEPSVSINATGQAVIVWQQVDGSGYTLWYATGPAGGALSSPAGISLAGSSENMDPQAGIDAAGELFAAYDTAGAADEGEIGVAYQPVGGSFQGDEPVSDQFNDQAALPGDAMPQLAVNSAGAAVVTWLLTTSVHNGPTPIVQAAFRPAGGAPNPCNCGQPWPGFYYDTPETLPEGDGDDSTDHAAAIDSSGNVLVAYVTGQDNLDNSGLHIDAAYRPSTAGENGSFDTPQTISDTSVDAQLPDVTFDSTGGAYVAWQQFASVKDVSEQAEVAYRPPNGSFAPDVLVSSPEADVSGGPEIGVDSQGRQTVLWASLDPNGTTPGDTFVEAAERTGTTGAFSTPTQLSTSGTVSAGRTPALSVASSGQAVALWQYLTPPDTNNISYDVAQASFGTPPGSTAPPPPPPPPAPIPNPITLAAPVQAGQAIVLTANVDSDVSSLDWQIGGLPTHAIGGKVAGVIQNSIRFHWFQQQVTVKLTVNGPSGSHTYSRSLNLPALPTDKTSLLVDDAAGSTPRVFGVGDASTLLGKTTCGPVSVYSGDQKVSGCLRPVNAVSDIPARELGVIQTLARSTGLDPNDSQVMDTAVERLDGYVGVGPTTLNDTWPVDPKGLANVMSFPGVGALTSSNASLDVAGLNFGGLSGGFSLNVDPLKPDIPLGTLPKPDLPDIGGFPVIGDWNVDLGTGDATIDAHLQLPSWISLGGVPLQIPITFRATPSGLVLDKLDIGPLSVDIGALAVNNFKLTYDRATDTWTGSGSVCLLTQVCLDMSPPQGEVKIVHGALSYAGATLPIPGGGVPLFPGVNLTQIGFGLGLGPTRLIGRGAISVLDLANLNGELVTAFPTAGHPFILARDEVGSDFPAEDYGPPFTEPTIGASADVQVNLPVVGDVTLGSGYLLYEIPDYIAVGGGVNVKVLDAIQIYGNIGGAANFSDHTLNLHAEAGACLLLIGKICASAAVNISRAPNDGGGAGGCVDVGGLHIGGGVLWAGPKIIVWPFDGCKWSRFKVDVRPSLASAAAATRTIVVRRGAPNPALELYGDGAAPLVRVTGPGGQSLDSTDSGFDHSPGGHIRILRYESKTENFTVVGLEHAQPGTYTVGTLPGSVPITEIASATDPPDAHVTATVGGTTSHRVLTYDIRNRPDQTVTFWDIDKGSAATAIGHVKGGGGGQVHFNPAPGNRRRTIVAQFTLDGLPAERTTVAHYQPPPATLPTPREVRVTRTNSGVRASWRSVPGATRYELVVTDRTTGYQHLVSTRRHTIVLKGIPRTVGGTLTVRALDKLRQSLTAIATFKRLAAPTNRFSKLARCKLNKGKITCTGGATKKPKKKPKPKQSKKRKKPTRRK